MIRPRPVVLGTLLAVGLLAAIATEAGAGLVRKLKKAAGKAIHVAAEATGNAAG